MKKIKLAVLGAAEIALRRFLPALLECENINYEGVASQSAKKVEVFQKAFGGKIYSSYEALLDDSNIDAVYIPLPPSLHFEWAKKAIEKGKHVFLEKPFTTKLSDTNTLIELAQKNNIALHENYMFLFHKQLKLLEDLLSKQTVGTVREYHINFGFPKREDTDFRYNKSLGGGALLDCGGYTVKLASLLLGESAKVTFSSLKYTPEYDVDLYGTAILENNSGEIAKISFGMDNAYKCELEVWGNKGTIYTDRIFTAPPDFSPTFIIKKGNEEERVIVEKDDQFYQSILYFCQLIQNGEMRANNYTQIARQSQLVEQILYK